jgi:hypothetical protein
VVHIVKISPAKGFNSHHFERISRVESTWLEYRVVKMKFQLMTWRVISDFRTRAKNSRDLMAKLVGKREAPGGSCGLVVRIEEPRIHQHWMQRRPAVDHA